MATRNPNLELPPDASSIIAEVNFTTTRAGLTGQVSTKMLYSSVIHVRIIHNKRPRIFIKKKPKAQVDNTKRGFDISVLARLFAGLT